FVTKSESASKPLPAAAGCRSARLIAMIISCKDIEDVLFVFSFFMAFDLIISLSPASSPDRNSHRFSSPSGKVFAAQSLFGLLYPATDVLLLASDHASDNAPQL